MEELDAGAREEAVDRAMQIIRNRIDGLGVAEPVILKQGNGRIVVDLPGYTDADRAEQLIGQMAVLEFKMMETQANSTLLVNKIDSAISAYEKARAGGDAAETESEATNSEPTEERSDNILADLLAGDSTIDTADLFAFDEEFGLDVF